MSAVSPGRSNVRKTNFYPARRAHTRLKQKRTDLRPFRNRVPPPITILLSNAIFFFFLQIFRVIIIDILAADLTTAGSNKISFFFAAGRLGADLDFVTGILYCR